MSAKITVVIAFKNDELSTCMICMDQPEVMVISKTCGHTACKDCIDHWLLEKCPFREKDDRYAMCPTCKQHLHASDLEEYSNTATIALKKNLTNYKYQKYYSSRIFVANSVPYFLE